jgi:hypothetical protein
MKIKLFPGTVYMLIGITWMFASCKYDRPIPHPEKYTSVYMPQAANNPVTYNFNISDTPQTIIYGADYGGPGYPDKNIIINFKVDTSFVDSFNLKNGTSYLPMPAGSYSLEKTSAVIPAGKLSTDPLLLSIQTANVIDPSTPYLLPVQITDAGNVQVNATLGITYFLIQGVYPVAPDSNYQIYDNKSKWKVIGFDSQDDYQHNLAANAIDGDTTTYWQTEWKNAKPGPPHWIEIEMDTVHVVHGLYFYPLESSVGKSGNPEDIHIDLSKDGKTWTGAGDYTLADEHGRQNIYLSFGLLARYFRVTVNNSFAGKYLTTIAETGTF